MRVLHLQVDGAYLHVVTCMVIFSGLFTQVFLIQVPYHVIFLVFNLVADVKISHLRGSGALFFDGAIGNA